MRIEKLFEIAKSQKRNDVLIADELREFVSGAFHTWVEWRRDLHKHPELGFEEVRTATVVLRHLRRLGYEVQFGFEVVDEASLPPRRLDIIEERRLRTIEEFGECSDIDRLAQEATGVVGMSDVSAYGTDL